MTQDTEGKPKVVQEDSENFTTLKFRDMMMGTLKKSSPLDTFLWVYSDLREPDKEPNTTLSLMTLDT